MSEHDEQQAVAAIASIAHWWQEHGWEDESPDAAMPQPWITAKPVDGPP